MREGTFAGRSRGAAARSERGQPLSGGSGLRLPLLPSL